MSYAVVVRNVYKQFGKPAEPLWQRLVKAGRRNSSNGTGANGQDLNQSAPADQLAGDNKRNGNGNHAQLAAPQRYVVAVDHVSFEVNEGEIFGILGPNGGGKSTLIRLISTLLLPDSGEVTVFGYDVVRQPMKVQERINRVSVEASFFKKLSPMENLLYGARLYGLEGKETRKQVYEILTRLGLERRAVGNPMEEMSRGMQQKVAIARALLSHPRLLLLDEPTTGLDPRSKHEVQAVVRELREKFSTTMILTTHDMVEAESLCDRIAIMDKGKVVALDTPAALRKGLPGKNGVVTTMEDVFLALTGKQLKEEEEQE